ncbi:MAG TPA: hypothetical protein VFZ67_10310 [Nitrososphaera sp.]
MLAGHTDRPFDNKDWVFEVKWDGVRAILLQNKAKGITEIQSRNSKNITHRYPEITKAIDSVVKNSESIVLDGEIVVLNEEGIPSFQMHQKRMNVESQRDIESLSIMTYLLLTLCLTYFTWMAEMWKIYNFRIGAKY